jgi:hypothetical protein
MRTCAITQGAGRVTCALSVVDCFGRTVILDHSNWQKHLEAGSRLEVVPYHDRIPEVLRDPDFVMQSDRDGQYHYYRRGLTSGPHADLFLVLVVGTDGGLPTLRTWRLRRFANTRGRVVWSR